MSLSSSPVSTHRTHKPTISSWRNQALNKNSSPARLTYVIAEPEHSTQVSKVSVNDALRRSPTKSLRVPRPASKCAIPRAARSVTDKPDSSHSTRTFTRAAHPALVSMVVRAPEKKAVTRGESPVSVNGLLVIPTSAKGKEKEKEKDAFEKPSEDLNMDPSSSSPSASGSNAAQCDDVIIPSPSLALSAIACSNPTLLPIPSIDADSSDPTLTTRSDHPTQQPQSDNPTNTPAEASSPPKGPAEPSASSKKEGSSWFTTSWLAWPSPAPNNSIANTPPGGGSHANDDGYLTNEQRVNQTGKARDGDGGDIDRQSPGEDNINCVRERSREDDVNKPSQASQSLFVADDGADKASMSITQRIHKRKTSVHGNSLQGSASVEGQNSTPTPTPTIQTSSHVDKLVPSTDPGSTVDMSATTTATTTPPDATAVSAPSASPSDLTPSASGLTNAGPTTTASQASWWNYVGWKSAAVPIPVLDPSTSMPPAASASAATSTHIPVASLSARASIDLDTSSKLDVPTQGASFPSVVAGSEPNVPKPDLASVLPDEGALEGDGDREQQQSQQVQAQVQEPQELLHCGHARNAVASSWYSPWSWYGSSSHPAVTDTHGAGEARANEESEKSEKVEEEQPVVEPRGGTQEVQVPQVSVSPPEEERPQPLAAAAAVATNSSVVVEDNPISATIDSHRSSWLSFFASTSSRALVTKRITAPQAPDCASVGGDIPNHNVKVDENGMEVMDIDDEGESPASQVSQTQPPSSDSSKTKEGAKDKESKALSTVSSLSTAQGLVATLVRGRGRVRSIQGRVDADKDGLKDGLVSDASSVRSGVGGQGSGTITPVNGMPIPSKPGATEPPATGTGSLSSSPASTTVSLVKRASLSLTGVGTKTSTATSANGNTTAANSTSTSATTAAGTTVTAATAAAGNDKNNKNNKSKSVSPTPSPTSKKPAPSPPLPNFVLPSWQETFHTAPRSVVPPRAEAGTLTKTVQYVSGWLFSGGRSGMSSLMGGSIGRRGREAGKNADKGKWKASSAERERGREREFMHFGMALPKAWDILNSATQAEATNLKEDVLRGSRRVVVIGVHGWFPGTVMRTVIGGPTGTSTKLANMMAQALTEFENEQGIQFEKVTKIPLEGEGTVKHRVEKLYSNLLGNKEWMDDLRTADAILVATHSQGSVVSTHLLDRLIADKYIQTTRNSVVTGPASSFPAAAGMETAPAPKVQRVCCLAMCGIHLGPLRYLSTSSLFQPYIQYVESPAARELFEFQNTNSEASKEYVKTLRSVLSNGVKMLYAASLNDQVVPLYSGLFTAASHPLILRALYIDGDAYNSSDFLANLLVLLLRILNSGIPDSGLLVHLSEATAGSLNGVGHSTPYEEIAIFSLAVKYLFLTNDGLEEHPELVLDPFNARQEQNDYEIPWALRDVIADERVIHYFSKEIVQLRDAFREWHPRTSILRDLKRKLQPIQRLPASFVTSRL